MFLLFDAVMVHSLFGDLLRPGYTFGDGSASVDLNLIANTTDTSTSLALPGRHGLRCEHGIGLQRLGCIAWSGGVLTRWGFHAWSRGPTLTG